MSSDETKPDAAAVINEIRIQVHGIMAVSDLLSTASERVGALECIKEGTIFSLACLVNDLAEEAKDGLDRLDKLRAMASTNAEGVSHG